MPHELYLGPEDESRSFPLWVSSDQEKGKKSLRPLVQVTVNGPGELPCPTGVTSDPGDRCSRELGMNNVPGFPAADLLKTNERACGRNASRHRSWPSSGERPASSRVERHAGRLGGRTSGAGGLVDPNTDRGFLRKLSGGVAKPGSAESVAEWDAVLDVARRRK